MRVQKRPWEKINSFINKIPMVKTLDIKGLINRSNATTELYFKILRETTAL